jgi:uncharacterized protein (TIGR02118 family)
MTITVHVAYPRTEGARFDFDYYAARHIPLVKAQLGAAGMTAFSASRGIAGRPIEEPPPFFMVATLTFPDEETLRSALGTADEVVADIPNFTDVEPHFAVGSVID